MPANMWDQSAILLNNQAGAILGQSLGQLGQGIARGIEDYRKKKKEKESEEAAIKWLQKNGADMGLDSTDAGELKAAVKAAGGGAQAIQLISALDTQKRQRAAAEQQRQLGEAQLQQMNDARQARLRSAGAARLATGAAPDADQTGALIQGGAGFQDLQPGEAGGAPDQVVADYLARSGDIAGAGGLAEAYSRLGVLNQKERGPYGATINGIPGVVANGNFITDPRLRDQDKPATREVNVGGKKLTVGPGDKYFDEQGNPVKFTPDRPPAAPPFELKATDPELYEAMRQEYLGYVQSRGAAGGESKPGAGEGQPKVKDDQFASAEDVRAAMRGGQITRARAEQILKSRFGYK